MVCLGRKQLLELFNCGGCKNYMVVTSDECTKSNYLELLSRGRLTIPFMQTADFLVVVLIFMILPINLLRNT